MPHFTESTVEDAALSWFGEVGYSVANAPHLAPGEIASERIRSQMSCLLAAWTKVASAI